MVVCSTLRSNVPADELAVEAEMGIFLLPNAQALRLREDLESGPRLRAGRASMAS